MSVFNPLERRVVITGIGTINSLGHSVKEYWENLAKGVSGGKTSRNPDLANFSVQIAAEVDVREEEVKSYYKARKLYKRLDRFIGFGFVAGAQAYEDAGIDTEKNPERYGAIIASGEGGLQTNYEQISRIRDRGLEAISPYYIPSVIPNTPSALLCQEKNLQGPSFAVSSACASANHAIGTAVNLIKMGMADAIFAGGAEAVTCTPSMAAFTGIGALSRRNHDPAHASRPFDRNRDGFLMGEGAGVLCLEELDHARRRGAQIYGEITGFGFTSDAYDLVAPHPNGEGAGRAIRMALNMAGLNPEDLDLINCHGTSTPAGDLAESKAIHYALGKEVAQKLPVHSTKSMIGHLIGAAGAVEAIAVLLAITKGIVHPSINIEEQDPEILLNVVREAREAKVKHALSDTFGFGGHNATIILSEFAGS